MNGNKDSELFKVMAESLNKYLKAAGALSKEGFDTLSQYNGLLWSEIKEQKETLESLLDKKEENTSAKTPKEEGNTYDERPKEHSDKGRENGPVKLYNSMVEFLKRQNCDELHWVKTYWIKCRYGDIADFHIKYFEHKDPAQKGRNYILFGNAAKNYSIRRVGDEILGDTSECFDIILNLSAALGID